MRIETVPITKIKCEDRIRQDVALDTEFLKSFDNYGQIQSLAVVVSGDGFRLLAGGRRLAAMHLKNIPEAICKIYEESELTPRQMREIELIETCCRKDFTFQERSKAIRDIHNLRVSENGAAISSSDTNSWTQQKTAELLGVDQKTVSNAIVIAESLEENPTIAKCKTQVEAMRAIKTARVEKLQKELNSRFEQGQLSGDEEQQKKKLAFAECYILGDCIQGLAGVPDGSIDLFELDPPWGIGYNSLGADYKEGYEDKPQDYIPRIQELLPEVYRCLKPNRWVIFWCAITQLESTKHLLRTYDFTVSDVPAIWKKLGQQGPNRDPEHVLTSNYECFLYAYKGSAVLTRPAVNTFDFIRRADNIHPSEKPVDLTQMLYATFGLAGFNVCIPYLGSGNGLFAANSLGMKAFGFDLSDVYRGGFLRRLQGFTVR